ncbi:uncharacterized protein LOC130103996 [Rhinichthys klamathensis goyatoka]|uniref:uncharacterized protein LOC130103996 n=1 Tax=Rhinichthys klamathensis goyatoka TaxID=3034132 RepID=UPI0024B54D75|nr:uncharacterized protein LOC130103996 [Rhinichthys klamathensis goyatoka]
MKRTKEVRENEINEEEQQRWGKGEHSEEIKTDTELPEEFYHCLEDLPWNLNSLEQLLYISLPAWVQRALLCNLAEQFGIWTFHNNILLCRLISYALLPYTLPTTTVFSFICRFLRWAKKLPHQALNAVREFKQEVIKHLRCALAHLRRLLPNRFLLLQIPPLVPTPAPFLAPWSCLPPLSLTFLPCSSLPLLSIALRFLSCRFPTSTWKKHPERRSQTQPLCFRQRSFLCFQLAGSGGFCKKTDNIITDAKPLSSTFLLQLNLKLEMDSHSETPQLQKDTLDYDRRALLDLDKHRNAEVNLSSPCISYMDVQEED